MSATVVLLGSKLKSCMVSRKTNFCDYVDTLLSNFPSLPLYFLSLPPFFPLPSLPLVFFVGCMRCGLFE